MKTVLITGGAGFLGSYLCERFIQRGDKVICCDNFYTGSTVNVEHLRARGDFSVLKHDITQPLDIKCDIIMNFACPASPVHYQEKPVDTLKTGILGVFNMAELAVKNNALLLQASTSEVYGDPDVSPQPETYRGNVNPIGIRACYDEAKRAGESILFDYHRQYGLKIKIIRIFNTYGPRMQVNDGRVVSNFIVQALNGEDITIYGDGSQTRSFCYVDDLADVIMRMVEKPGFTGPVNTGNPSEMTVKELAEQVIKLTGSSSRLVFRPLPADDPLQRRPDITLARSVLGWSPQVELETGLQKTIAYFRKVLGK